MGLRAAIVRGQSGEQISSSNNNSWVWIILALTRGRSRGRSSLVTTNNKLSGDNQELTSITLYQMAFSQYQNIF